MSPAVHGTKDGRETYVTNKSDGSRDPPSLFQSRGQKRSPILKLMDTMIPATPTTTSITPPPPPTTTTIYLLWITCRLSLTYFEFIGTDRLEVISCSGCKALYVNQSTE